MGEDEGVTILGATAAELFAHGQRSLGDSLGRIALHWYRAHNTRVDSGLAAWMFRLGYVDLALQLGAISDATAAAEGMLSDSLGMKGDADEYTLWAHGSLGIVAAARGDRAGALAEIHKMPAMTGLTRQMR